MPETIDALTGWLDDSCRQTLREWFTLYKIEILSCVYWRNRAPWRVSRRRCFDSFFLFPTRGKVHATLASGRKVISPGQYLALPDGEWHSLEIEKGHAHLDQLSLHCRIQDRWQRPFLSRFHSRMGSLENKTFWHRSLTDLAFLMKVDHEVGQQRGETLVRELLAARLRGEKKLRPLNRTGDPRIERVLQRMKEELSSPLLSVETLSREIDLTSTQMRKLFRREMCSSPGRYLQKLRLERATHLLRHSTQSIKQIALESGFASDNYFHLVFRKAFNLTPIACRNMSAL